MTTTRDDLDAWFAKADDVLEWHPGYGDAFEWHAPEPNFDCPEPELELTPEVELLSAEMPHLDGESRLAWLLWFESSRPEPNFDCPPLPDTATRLATFAQQEGLDGESARALYAVSAMLGFRAFGEVLSAALGRVSVEFRVLTDVFQQAFDQLGADAERVIESIARFAREAGLLPDLPPTQPMARALWLRQHRNTGPALPRMDGRMPGFIGGRIPGGGRVTR